MRFDRPYCASNLFRELVLDNMTATEADCRQSISERIKKCNRGVCPKCISPCNYPIPRALSGALKCLDINKHFGFLHFYMVTDAGQLARSMHGARRKDNYIPVSLMSLHHHTCVNALTGAFAVMLRFLKNWQRYANVFEPCSQSTPRTHRVSSQLFHSTSTTSATLIRKATSKEMPSAAGVNIATHRWHTLPTDLMKRGRQSRVRATCFLAASTRIAWFVAATL